MRPREIPPHTLLTVAVTAFILFLLVLAVLISTNCASQKKDHGAALTAGETEWCLVPTPIESLGVI